MSYLLLGLGNPGLDYEKTRHNAGYIFIDGLVDLTFARPFCRASDFLMWKFVCESDEVYLVKPLTFMNFSGSCLRQVCLKSCVFSFEQVCVVCDNMDLGLGRAKLKRGGGSAGQKGLQNIIDASGTCDFWRLYIGIDRPKRPEDVRYYVVSRFPGDSEMRYLNVCKTLAQDFYLSFNQGFVAVQKIINEKWKNVS